VFDKQHTKCGGARGAAGGAGRRAPRRGGERVGRRGFCEKHPTPS